MVSIIDHAAITAAHELGEIQARPRPHAHAERPRTGELTLASTRVYVPPTYRADRPAGVLVMLHGAGATAEQSLWLVKELASEANVIVVAPKSQRATWDVIESGLGPDVAQIDRALATVFAAYSIDEARVAIGGFSDGASYALTLGLANGDLFRTILAFSPGFELAPRQQGTPRVLVWHGIADRVLPIDRTSRKLVPRLRAHGLAVDFHEFTGGHTVPAEALQKAFEALAPGRDAGTVRSDDG